MFTEYFEAAMRCAHCALVPDGEGVYIDMLGLSGVCANGDAIEETRGDLQSALECWIALAIAGGIEIPDLDVVSITIAKVA